MAVKFLFGIDLNQTELQNAVVQNLATGSIPTGTSGQIVFDSTTAQLKYHDGSSWKVIAEVASVVNTIAAGDGIVVSGTTAVTVSHSDTSSALNHSAQNRTYVNSLTFDDFGHVTAYSVATETDTTDYINAAAFNTGTGVLTLSGVGNAGATVDLDGRYLQITDEAPAFSVVRVAGEPNVEANDIEGVLTLVAGQNVSITTDAVTDEITINSSYVNNYVNSASFNTADGVLTLGRAGLGNVTVDLDGRYHIANASFETLDSVTHNGATTTNSITVGGLVVNGNLSVSGAVQTKVSETLLVEDALFVLNSNETGAPTNDAGFVVERGTSANAMFIWDESADEFVVATTTETGSTAGNAVISAYAKIHAGAGEFDGILNLGSVVNAGTDTDKFLVLDASGNVDFRTGAQVLSDIGGAVAGAMYSFNVSDGTTAHPIVDGETVTFTAGGDLAITNVAGNINIENTYAHPTYTARSINTSGASVLDIFTSDTQGHVTNITTRTLTLADLGYTGATNANFYVLPDATTTVVGGVELATTAEAAAGTDTSRAVTPQGLTSFIEAREHKETIGNGVDTEYNVVHNLGTTDVIVQIYDIPTGDTVFTDVTRVDINTVRVRFAAPADQIRVLITKID